jgi:hypothetical protein
VFNIPTFLGGNKPPQTVPEYQRPGYISEEPAETILYHTPVIKTVDAPDLAQVTNCLHADLVCRSCFSEY